MLHVQPFTAESIQFDLLHARELSIHSKFNEETLWRQASQAIAQRMVPRQVERNFFQVIQMPSQNLSGGIVKRRREPTRRLGPYLTQPR